MGTVWIVLIALLIFTIVTFLYWKLTRNYAEKAYGKKMWNQWGTRTFYWQGALLIGGGVTVLIVFLLKSAHVLTF